MFLDEVLAPIQAAGAANPWGSGAPSPAALPSAHGTLLACSTGLAHNKVMGADGSSAQGRVARA